MSASFAMQATEPLVQRPFALTHLGLALVISALLSGCESSPENYADCALQYLPEARTELAAAKLDEVCRTIFPEPISARLPSLAAAVKQMPRSVWPELLLPSREHANEPMAARHHGTTIEVYARNQSQEWIVRELTIHVVPASAAGQSLFADIDPTPLDRQQFVTISTLIPPNRTRLLVADNPLPNTTSFLSIEAANGNQIPVIDQRNGLRRTPAMWPLLKLVWKN